MKIFMFFATLFFLLSGSGCKSKHKHIKDSDVSKVNHLKENQDIEKISKELKKIKSLNPRVDGDEKVTLPYVISSTNFRFIKKQKCYVLNLNFKMKKTGIPFRRFSPSLKVKCKTNRGYFTQYRSFLVDYEKPVEFTFFKDFLFDSPPATCQLRFDYENGFGENHSSNPIFYCLDKNGISKSKCGAFSLPPSSEKNRLVDISPYKFINSNQNNLGHLFLLVKKLNNFSDAVSFSVKVHSLSPNKNMKFVLSPYLKHMVAGEQSIVRFSLNVLRNSSERVELKFIRSKILDKEVVLSIYCIQKGMFIKGNCK